MKCNRIFLWLVLVAGLISNYAQAGNTTIKQEMDSMVIVMGKQTALKVTIVKDKDVQGQILPKLAPIPGDSTAMQLTPQIEVSGIHNDTTNIENGRVQIVRTMMLQAYDSGVWVVPAAKFAVGRDTVSSEELNLKVIPVNVDSLQNIHDYKDVADAPFVLSDLIPDFIYNYWWAYLLVILLGVAAWYAYYRHKQGKPIIPKKAIVVQPPYEEAVEALSHLKEAKLWQNGHDKEYFSKLTDILRRYIDRRFLINAIEMTSAQIVDTLKKNEETKAVNEQLKQILEVADFVKFAGVMQLPEDNEAAWTRARNFVELTRPAEIPEEVKASSKGKGSRKSPKGKSKKQSLNPSSKK